jgi:hypothetical protein
MAADSVASHQPDLFRRNRNKRLTRREY